MIVKGKGSQKNMAIFNGICQRPEQSENVNFEPKIRGLKSDIFDSDEV